MSGRLANDSSPFYFQLTLFRELGASRYLFFSLTLLLYAVIVSFNVVIIMVICLEKTLHEPMYVFISCLSLNSLYGSSGFFPRFLMDLLSDTHLISRPACFTQIYIIYTYASYELFVLSIMAYDRYVAICKPLHYHSIMSPRTMCMLVAAAWLIPVFSLGGPLYLTIRLPLCGNQLPRVFCATWPVVQLSCVDTTPNSIAGLLVSTTTVFLPLCFVLYTYLRILLVCQQKSSEFRGKALQTCLPHIVTFVNYSISGFCEVSLSRFKADQLDPNVVMILSLEFLIIPCVFNPVVYGLNLPKIRKLIFRLVHTNTISP
ncbi:olfactory receptor 4B13-like [Aplochiton taeniatus]